MHSVVNFVSYELGVNEIIIVFPSVILVDGLQFCASYEWFQFYVGPTVSGNNWVEYCMYPGSGLLRDRGHII